MVSRTVSIRLSQPGDFSANDSVWSSSDDQRSGGSWFPPVAGMESLDTCGGEGTNCSRRLDAPPGRACAGEYQECAGLGSQRYEERHIDHIEHRRVAAIVVLTLVLGNPFLLPSALWPKSPCCLPIHEFSSGNAAAVQLARVGEAHDALVCRQCRFFS